EHLARHLAHRVEDVTVADVAPGEVDVDHAVARAGQVGHGTALVPAMPSRWPRRPCVRVKPARRRTGRYSDAEPADCASAQSARLRADVSCLIAYSARSALPRSGCSKRASNRTGGRARV